jgi:hypothetical protein
MQTLAGGTASATRATLRLNIFGMERAAVEGAIGAAAQTESVAARERRHLVLFADALYGRGRLLTVQGLCFRWTLGRRRLSLAPGLFPLAKVHNGFSSVERAQRRRPGLAGAAADRHPAFRFFHQSSRLSPNSLSIWALSHNQDAR